VRAVHDFRGTYNVSDYRWFNLRDGNTSSPALFQHFGLLEDDYDPKPAFSVYRSLVRRLGTRRPAGPRRPRIELRFRCRRGRVRATVAGRDARFAIRAEFFRGRTRVGRDAHSPLSRIVDSRCHAGRRRVRARVRMGDGRLVRLSGPIAVHGALDGARPG
jgi:hypothetical protein